MAAAQLLRLESIADSSRSNWDAALSPENGHLAGGLPRKRPPRPLVAPYAGNGHCGWGGWRKTATPRVCVNGSHLEHIAPTQESLFTTHKLCFFIGPSGIDSHTTNPTLGLHKSTPPQFQTTSEAMECSTCCYPFSKQDLFGCDTDRCDTVQFAAIHLGRL